MAKRIVVALGGNALGNTPEEQLDLVRHTAKTIVDLSEAGYEVIVGHGNGPQVGMINLAMEFSSTKGGNTPYMPFPECGAGIYRISFTAGNSEGIKGTSYR